MYFFKICNFILIILVVMTTVCYGSETIEKYAEETEKLYRVYLNGDIDAAEEALKSFLDITRSYQKANVEGINYDSAFGFTYVRLYLIYQERKLFDKAEFYINKALTIHIRYYENDHNKKLSNHEIIKERKKLIEFVKGMDQQNSAKWLN